MCGGSGPTIYIDDEDLLVVPSVSDGKLESTKSDGIGSLRCLDKEWELPFGISCEDGIASGSGAGLKVGGACFKRVSVDPKPVLKSPSGLDVLTVFLHYGNVWVAAEDGDFLPI